MQSANSDCTLYALKKNMKKRKNQCTLKCCWETIRNQKLFVILLIFTLHTKLPMLGALLIKNMRENSCNF